MPYLPMGTTLSRLPLFVGLKHDLFSGEQLKLRHIEVRAMCARSKFWSNNTTIQLFSFIIILARSVYTWRCNLSLESYAEITAKTLRWKINTVRFWYGFPVHFCTTRCDVCWQFITRKYQKYSIWIPMAHFLEFPLTELLARPTPAKLPLIAF